MAKMYQGSQKGVRTLEPKGLTLAAARESSNLGAQITYLPVSQVPDPEPWSPGGQAEVPSLPSMSS